MDQSCFFGFDLLIGLESKCGVYTSFMSSMFPADSQRKLADKEKAVRGGKIWYHDKMFSALSFKNF